MAQAMEAGMEWVAVAALKDLGPDALLKVESRGQVLALLATPQGPRALADACAHEGASLSEGRLENGVLQCPLHAYRYDAATGACLNEPRLCQRRFEAKAEGGQVWVQLPKLAAQAAPAPQDPASARSGVEQWKQAKHPLDSWDDLLRFARESTPQTAMSVGELERMKWFGFFQRKANDPEHYMTRVRIPGCAMTAQQLRALAYVAKESGHGLLDITTRGNIQIQGLTIESLPGVAATLEASGLTARQSGHDNVRNVTSHPLSGLDPQELLDTRPLARALQARIVGDHEFSDLPRKFNPAFCGRSAAPAHVWTQDLAFVALHREDGRVAFRPLLGGSQGQSPTLAWAAPVWVEPEQALDFSLAVIRVFRAKGWRHNRHQVRLHFLMERLGNDAFLDLVRAELDAPLEACDATLPAPERDEDLVGWLPQKQDGLWTLGVCVPVGRLDWQKAEGLARLAERFGSGELRSSTDQNLLLCGVPTARKAEAAMALAALGLSHENDSVTRNVMACTGKQFCNLAIGETKGTALRLSEALRRRGAQLQGVRIAMSGCPNSCGLTLTADIGLQGTKVRRGGRSVEAFDVYLGGGVGDGIRLARLARKGVPSEELAHFIHGLLDRFYAERAEGQHFTPFWRAVLERDAPDFSQDPPRRWACGGCAHLALGDVPPSSCPVCAAVRARFEPAPEDSEASLGGFLTLPSAVAPIVAPPVVPAATPVAAPQPVAAAAPARRILIVGGGIAAHSAAQAARKLDPTCAITLLTDEAEGYYNRLNLTRYLGRDLSRQGLFDYDADWYRAQAVTLQAGRAVGLDPSAHRLSLADGSALGYDACILAHGARPSLPVFWREGLESLQVLRTLRDADRLADRFRPGLHVSVVGGGVLGVETACAAIKGGAQVTLIEVQPGLMPRQLDAESAALLRSHLEGTGLNVRVDSGIRELKGSDKVERVVFTDGSEIVSDLVVVCAGVAPEVDWLRAAGLDCARGVCVDDGLRTSAPDVYACGDVAEWRGHIFGLWNHAQEQGELAGAAALDRPVRYQGSLPVTLLKGAGIDCISLGEIPGDGMSVATRTQRAPGVLRRLFLRRGIPVGAILLGSAEGLGSWKRLVEDGQALERTQAKLWPDDSMVSA